MIKLNINELDLQNDKKILEIAKQLLQIQLSGTNSIKKQVEKKQNYYYGKAPLVENGKTINIIKPLVDTATNTFFGDTPDLFSSVNKKTFNSRVSNIEKNLLQDDYETEISAVVKDCSINGYGLIELYHEQGDKITKFKRLDPKYSNTVCDCSTAEKHLLSFNIVEVATFNNGKYTKRYDMYIYTKDYIYSLQTANTQVSSYEAINLQFSKDFCFIIDNNLVYDYKIEHEYDGIPVIEFGNNYDRLGDTECAYGLAELYNELQNNRVKNIKDVVNYLLLLKNVRVGDEEETEEAKDLIIKDRILAITGDNADAKFLTNPLDQTQVGNLANSIVSDIHKITGIPDLSSTDFSQNASDPILKIKTKPLLDLCKEKAKWFTKSFRKMLDLVVKFAINYDSKVSYDIDLSKISINFHIKLPSNDADMITMITNLANSRMANPRILLNQLSFVKDIDEYIEGMEERNESIDKAKQLDKNSNMVANENNLEKQKPISKDMFDNKNNGNLGLANRISDNKVE